MIIEASIGPICVVECVEEPESCDRADFCECRIVYALINQRIAQVLEEFTLEDLLDPSWITEKGVDLERQLVRLEGLPSSS